MTRRTCVILQPSYIPWRGFFHQIYAADEFVFYDDVQYDKGGWRNRNRIKGPRGSQWLTIPVKSGGAVTRSLRINEIHIDHSQPWRQKHWETLCQFYARAPYFTFCAPVLEPFYLSSYELLADFTIELTSTIARDLLAISHTRFQRSSCLGIEGDRTGRLVAICRALETDRYVSGPAARDYLDETQFLDAGITVEYMRYEYPEYEQRFPPFDPKVSVLDLLFAVGPEAPKYIWGSSERA